MNVGDLNEVREDRLKRKMRVGRGVGSGHGKTAGRGTKGHKSRTGYSRRWGFEGGQMPLYRRLPKRGFTNALFRVEYSIVNTGALDIFEEGATIDIDVLKKAGLLTKNSERLKILAKGALSRRLIVKADRFSDAARQMIESLGGTAQEIG